MAPSAIEPPNPPTPEYTEFIQKLVAFHEKRGTNFEATPKIGHQLVNLHHLFNTVVERGGYDRLSDEKLAWRKLGQDLNLGPSTSTAIAFILKSTYYKNLAAYEITTIHGREPPPREILEDVTAKGGGLLTRTIENFRPSQRRETSQLGHDSEADEEGTPVRESNTGEEAPGSGGRVTRGLRQAPPQRQLWQPDTSSSRPARHVTAAPSSAPSHHQQHQQHQHHTQPPRGPSTSYNPASNMDNISQAVANYEPRPQMPLTLRAVVTPGNAPAEFAKRQKAQADAAAIASGRAPASAPQGPMLPGTGFDGPNIYVRCLCALKSGVKSEQEYALHHLVKISMERGDKYRFEGFPGLAEALIDKVLEVGSLFYKVAWEVSYTDEGEVADGDVLNGVDGTPDILQRIGALTEIEVDDNIQTSEHSDKMLQINEAALTLRNMVMLEENAYYVSEMSPLRDCLSIALNLPNKDSVVELKHYALEIAEQLTKYMRLGETDPLYTSLLDQLLSSDRGAILTSLRAICRISMNLEENNLLKGVPAAALQNILDWTMLNDEDLIHACLDFLYQFTAVVENVDFLISNLRVEPLVNQLVRLLMHGGRVVEREYLVSKDTRRPAPSSLAHLPHEVFSKLIKIEEPERSSLWLRCLFEEDPDESITQIALWQAYQACFTNALTASGAGLLPASEFIKNVSTTFSEKAAAQVQGGPVQKYLIKGIRMRHIPIDTKGEEASKCFWKGPFGGAEPCGQFFIGPESMYHHILQMHLGAFLNSDAKYDNTMAGRDYTCLWNGCERYPSKAPATKLSQIASHIKLHLPRRATARKEANDSAGPSAAKRARPSYIVPGEKRSVTFYQTATDERDGAAGVPLSAVLVLRNLARNVSRTDTDAAAKLAGGEPWVDRLFKSVMPRLFDIMAHNKSLTVHLTDLINAIRSS